MTRLHYLQILAAFVLTTLCASAQNNVSRLLTDSLRQAVAGVTPIPKKDRAEVIAATAALLAKHVTFRPDGTASTVSTALGSRQNLEWKELAIKMVRKQSLTDADKLNGFSKRYTAILGSTAVRRWDTKANAWTVWSPTGHHLFPSGIVVEWKNGKRTARGNDYLPKFSPGPGPSIADVALAPEDNKLPPGMKLAE